MQISVQKFSPRWLKDHFANWREQCFRSIVQKIETSRFQDLLNLVLFVLFCLLSFKWDAVYSSASHVLRNSPHLALIGLQLKYGSLVFALLAVGTLSAYMNKAELPKLQFFGLIVGSSALVVFAPEHLAALEVWLYLLINYGIFFAFYLWYRKTRTALSTGHYFFSIFILIILLRPPTIAKQDLVWVIDSARFLFVLSFLTLETKANVSKFTSEESWSYFFSPVHLLTPLPIESINWKYDSSWEVRLRGLMDVVCGLMFLALAFWLKQKLVALQSHTPPASSGRFLLYGFVNYIYYFLGSFSWIAIPAGVARWYGISLPAYFDAPLLATSPFERWKRWNIYYYNWLNKLIFFPVFKNTKSLALGVAAVFLVTIFIHEGRFIDAILYRPQDYFLRVLFFTAHGLCVYLSLVTRNWWPSEDHKRGWCGVAVVTFLMSVIHLLGR